MALTLRERNVMYHTETDIEEQLRKGNVTVTFRKKDGTERVMNCTTNFDTIPSEKHPKGTGNNLSKEVCRCFDTDINEWSSFRWDSVISFEF